MKFKWGVENVGIILRSHGLKTCFLIWQGFFTSLQSFNFSCLGSPKVHLRTAAPSTAMPVLPEHSGLTLIVIING